MNDVEKSAITYGKALAQPIRAFDVLEPKAGWFERMPIKLLQKSYRLPDAQESRQRPQGLDKQAEPWFRLQQLVQSTKNV